MLHPVRMVRLEIVAPIQETEKIIRVMGDLKVANFIDITRTKADKYKTITDEVKKVDREDLLLQLSNRINNIARRLEQIPAPQPVLVEANPNEILKDIDKRIAILEEDYAKIENVLKSMAEEKTSLEKEIRQIQEEHGSLKKALSEANFNLSEASRIEPTWLGKENVKAFYEKLVEIQKALTFADIASRLSSPHEHITNDEPSLRQMSEMIKDAARLNSQVSNVLTKTSANISKVEEILNSVKEVVEKKLEAIGKLNEAKSSGVTLKASIEEYLRKLNPRVLDLSGKYTSSLDAALKTIGIVETIQLGSADLEGLAKEMVSFVSKLRGYLETLENLEKYLLLDVIVSIINEIRGGRIEDIKDVFEGSKELLKHLPAKRLQTVEKAFEILYSEKRLKMLMEQPETFKEDLYKLARSADYVHVYKEIVEIELTIALILKKLRQTEKASALEAWVGKTELSRAVRAIEAASPLAVVNVTKEEKNDRIPTLINHPKLVMPFQKLVTTYGIPNYRELDPTIIFVITFPIIFGLMFGDMGHGLIIFIGGIFLNQIWDKLKFKGEIWDMIREARFLIIPCGICSIIFGFLYGEFFGPTTLQFAQTQGPGWPTWYTDIFRFFGLDLKEKPWISPIDNMIPFFKICMFIGIAHIFLGIIMDIYNKLSTHQIKESILPFSWLWFYGSLSYLFIAVMGPQFTPSEVVLNPVLLAMFIFGPFGGMFVLHKFVVGSLLEAFSEAAAKFIESISNTFSYARILALGAAHGIFGKLALMGAGGNPAVFLVLFIVILLLMIIALEGILSFAHTLRLHWVEWFSKFYKGDGSPFESFTIQRKFTVAK